MRTIRYEDATYGHTIPAGRNPTLLAWYTLEIDGPFDTQAEAREALRIHGIRLPTSDTQGN